MPHALVVGTGRMARLRIPHLLAAGLEVSLTGRDPERTGAVAEQLGIAAVDLSAAAEGRYEAVLVTSASDDHDADLRRFADCAPVVFCEKPLATSSADAAELRQFFDRRGTEVYVGFQRRFDPAAAEAKAFVEEGGVGKLLHVQSSHFDHTVGRPEFIEKSGGMFKDMLIHDIDWLLWSTGLAVRSLAVMGDVAADENYRRYGDCDMAAIACTLEGGAVAVLRASRVHPNGQDVRMEYLGSEGAITVGLTAHSPIRSIDGDLGFGVEPVPQDFIERFQAAFDAESSRFAEYLVGRRDRFEGCTLGEAIRALELAEDCDRAWRRSEVIRYGD